MMVSTVLRRVVTPFAMLVWTAAAVAHEDSHGHGHGVHEHGVSDMTLVVEGRLVEMELESPAANLIGFEHRPRDAKQQAMLDRAVESLNDGATLFGFDPAAADCRQVRVILLSSLLHEDDEDDHHDHHGHDHDHADIFAAWRFECAGGALRGIDLGSLFNRFPGIERVRVQVATDSGQTARDLTAGSSRLRW